MTHFLIHNPSGKDLKPLFKELGLICYEADGYFKYPRYYVATMYNETYPRTRGNEVSIKETSGNGALLGSKNEFTFPQDYKKWKQFMIREGML